MASFEYKHDRMSTTSLGQVHDKISFIVVNETILTAI